MAKDANKSSKKEKKKFMKDFKSELKKVTWLTPKELVKNSMAVITIVLIVAVIVFILDLAFKSINDYGIDKLKDFVSSESYNNEEETNTTTENAEEVNTEDNAEDNTEDNTEEVLNTVDENAQDIPTENKNRFGKNN